MGTLI